MENTKKAARRRYYLHRRTKVFFSVNARRKEVILPQSEADKIAEHKAYKYLQMLIDLGYNVQLTTD